MTPRAEKASVMCFFSQPEIGHIDVLKYVVQKNIDLVFLEPIQNIPRIILCKKQHQKIILWAAPPSTSTALLHTARVFFLSLFLPPHHFLFCVFPLPIALSPCRLPFSLSLVQLWKKLHRACAWLEPFCERKLGQCRAKKMTKCMQETGKWNSFCGGRVRLTMSVGGLIEIALQAGDKGGKIWRMISRRLILGRVFCWMCFLRMDSGQDDCSKIVRRKHMVFATFALPEHCAGGLV